MLNFLTAGESHGRCLSIIIEGLPSGIKIDKRKIDMALEERQAGFGRGERMKIEKDSIIINSGVRGGVTLGSPVSLTIENRDWENWKKVISPLIEEIDPEMMREKEVLYPRAGHADLAGAIKYNHKDIRNVLERASARETASRVAVGEILSQFLSEFNIEIEGYVIQIGEIIADNKRLTMEEIRRRLKNSKLRCLDKEAEEKMIKKIEEVIKEGDTLGGAVEVRAINIPIGLGSYTQWDRRLNANLARAVMSIPTIKAVEIGKGIESSKKRGFEVHDEIFYKEDVGFYRKSNYAGGIEGGVSNGEDIILRAYGKPIPTLKKGLSSVDIRSKKPHRSSYERSDYCVLPAISIIARAMVAIEISKAFLEKFGGDNLKEIKKRFKDYQDYCRSF
jgi:chorismate synthase